MRRPGRRPPSTTSTRPSRTSGGRSSRSASHADSADLRAMVGELVERAAKVLGFRARRCGSRARSTARSRRSGAAPGWRCSREALTNTARHAEATRVWVHARGRPAGGAHGRGRRPRHRPGRRRRAACGTCRERAEDLEGTCTVESAPGERDRRSPGRSRPAEDQGPSRRAGKTCCPCGHRSTVRAMTADSSPTSAEPSAAEPIRVFLLDDHEIVRRGLKELLESEGDIEVVGESGLAQEATRRIPALRPTSRSSTAGSPTGRASTSAGRSGRKNPEIAALILTSYDDDEALFSAIMAGAAGYVLKQVRGQRPRRDRTPGRGRPVHARPGRHPAGAGPAAPRARGGPGARPADHPGAPDPRADRRGHDQPADRRGDVPRREDREELRVRRCSPSSASSDVPRRRCSPPSTSGTDKGPLMS